MDVLALGDPRGLVAHDTSAHRGRDSDCISVEDERVSAPNCARHELVALWKQKTRICGSFPNGASRARTGDLLGAIWSKAVATLRRSSPSGSAARLADRCPRAYSRSSVTSA